MNLINIVRQLFNPSPIEWPGLGDDIESLGRDVLSPQEFEEAEQLTRAIISGGKLKKHAIDYLQGITNIRPKRPMHYITELYLPHFPLYTRDIMHYLGAHLDELIKCVVQEHHHGLIYIPRSMGPNIRSLSGVIPPEMQKQLTRFNKNIYVPAKHDFDVQNREHRFTSREVVLTILITMKLCEKIKAISMLARAYAADKLPE